MDFYDDWPKSYKKRLELLRALDDRGIRRKLYLEKTAQIFDALAADAQEIIDELPGVDVHALDIGPLYRYYKAGRTGDALADAIITRIKPECEKIGVSQRVYAIPYVFFALLVVQGDREGARDFFDMLTRPLVIAYRIRQMARYRAKMGGGRPVHRLKIEAVALADKFFTDNPAAPLSRCVQFISGIFVSKYSDPPAASTIRKWLTNIYRNDK
ncbi:hypothetical protein [Salmonella enterica]|uniref:hypothetical protein n=1 Tax=Salmonella enterica TaxID=28901 RepID=UPI0009B15735|nr:hypothetical protein [Salmonella enterica]